MNETLQKFPFSVEILDKLAFPTQKEADVLSDTNTPDTVNKEHQGENHGGPELELQDLNEGGGDFSQNLESFLTQKKPDGKHEEKEEKAKQLGMVEPEQPKQ
jgi:hypothetical protein